MYLHLNIIFKIKILQNILLKTPYHTGNAHFFIDYTLKVTNLTNEEIRVFCLCSSLNKLVKWQCPEIQNDVSTSTVFAGLMICVKSHTCTQSSYAESPSWALGTRAL